MRVQGKSAGYEHAPHSVGLQLDGVFTHHFQEVAIPLLMPFLLHTAGVSPQTLPPAQPGLSPPCGGQVSTEQKDFQGEVMLAPVKCSSFWEEKMCNGRTHTFVS